MTRAIVVVPCYNEAKRLNMRAIQEFGRRAESAELLFVNDGSRDETLELIEYLHRNNPRRFSFLHLANNGGKAEAVRQGLLVALRSGADYVGYWDADLATPLGDIEAFCRVLDSRPQLEAVIGTRLRLLGHKVERMALRYYLGRVFANTASLVLGLRIFDTQCGAKLFRVVPLTHSLFARPFATRWIFDVEIFARMILAGGGSLAERIYEFPLDEWREVAGGSVKPRDFAKAFFEMAKICWIYFRPGALRIVEAAPAPLAAGPAIATDEPRPEQQQAA